MGKRVAGPPGIKDALYSAFNKTFGSKKRQAESKHTFLSDLKKLSYDDDPGVREAVALNLAARLKEPKGLNAKGRLIKDIFACRFNLLVLEEVARNKTSPPWAIASIVSEIIPKSGLKGGAESTKRKSSSPMRCYSIQNIDKAFNIISGHAARKESIEELRSINPELAREVINRFPRKAN